MHIATMFLAVLLMVTAPGPQGGLTARGLFINKKADAIEVRILDDKTNSPVFPNQVFKGGDEIRIEIEANFEGYLYIINLEMADRETNRFLLFPGPSQSDNRLKADEAIKLPTTFDKKPALEILQVIVSRDRIDFLDSALKGPNCDENRCELDQVIGGRVAQLFGGAKPISSRGEGGIFSKGADRQPKESSVRTRNVIVSAGKDNQDKSTYMAVPIGGGEAGRLKSGQIFAFEIRLKHI